MDIVASYPGSSPEPGYEASIYSKQSKLEPGKAWQCVILCQDVTILGNKGRVKGSGRGLFPKTVCGRLLQQ